VVHTDDEQEQYHGQRLTAQYLTTETWQRQNGTWNAAPDLLCTIRRESDDLTGQKIKPSR